MQADVAPVAFAWCLSPGASAAGQPGAERGAPKEGLSWSATQGLSTQGAWRFREMGPGGLFLSAARRRCSFKPRTESPGSEESPREVRHWLSCCCCHQAPPCLDGHVQRKGPLSPSGDHVTWGWSSPLGAQCPGAAGAKQRVPGQPCLSPAPCSSGWMIQGLEERWQPRLIFCFPQVESFCTWHWSYELPSQI